MRVKGCDCAIVIKTMSRTMDVPYTEETIREAVSLLYEEAAIEGDGTCRAVRKSGGVTGCVVTPLTMSTAPLLLYLAMGYTGEPLHITVSREIYKYSLKLMPSENSAGFDVIQDRSGGSERILYEGCRVKGFELRFAREEAIKLKLDITGKQEPFYYPYEDTFAKETGEMFNGDNVKYEINGKEYKNIYGLTLASRKEGGTRTELWIKRSLDNGFDVPDIIDEIVITAELLREKYENRHFGTFRITVKRLVLTSDETSVNSAGAVLGQLRYYVAGTVSTEVFSTTSLHAGC